MKAVLTETFIKNIVLVDDSEYAPGRTRFWHDLQDFMSQQLIAFILIISGITIFVRI